MKIYLKIVFTLLFLCCSGCVTYFGYDGPYEGRVIDKDTRQPIMNAVVHGTWVKSYPGPGGASSKYYDSKEVLTDKEGNFKISGVGLLIFSNMEEIELNVFKAGYEQRHNYWSSPRRDEAAAPFVEWDGDKAIIKLRRMTMDERRERTVTSPGYGVPERNLRLFRKENDKENIEIGRPKSTLYYLEQYHGK